MASCSLGSARKPAVAAECLFVDPVSDLAVLGPPDNQVFDEESDDYDALVEDIEPLAVSAAITDRDVEQRAWMLSLAGDWFPCKVKHHGGPWWPADCAQPIEGGMSGSPILDDAGAGHRCRDCIVKHEPRVAQPTPVLAPARRVAFAHGSQGGVRTRRRARPIGHSRGRRQARPIRPQPWRRPPRCAGRSLAPSAKNSRYSGR